MHWRLFEGRWAQLRFQLRSCLKNYVFYFGITGIPQKILIFIKGDAKNPFGTHPTFSAKAGIGTKSTYLPTSKILPKKLKIHVFETQDY